MQTKESEKSNLELPALKNAESNAMGRRHRKFLIALWLIAASLLPSARPQETNNKPEQAPPTPKTVVNAAPATAPTIRTSTGIVRGVTEEDVSIFKGVPFAAAPVGDNRWRPPQPLPAWQGVRECEQVRRGLCSGRIHPRGYYLKRTGLSPTWR